MRLIIVNTNTFKLIVLFYNLFGGREDVTNSRPGRHFSSKIRMDLPSFCTCKKEGSGNFINSDKPICKTLPYNEPRYLYYR
jgi:hypothetical protein